jgi:YggT family protein
MTVLVFVYAIIIVVVLSWVAPGAYNPATRILHSLTAPLLGRAQRLVPPMGGLDLSPLIALLALELSRRLVLAPLRDLAAGL